MSHKKEKFSSIGELNISAMSRGISPGELASDVGFPWKGHRIVLTGDGIFHFFREGMEVATPGFLVDISEISNIIYDKITDNVVIPFGVTSIGDREFYGCGWLTGVTIPNSVTSIGDRAFAYCKGLTSVTIPDSVTRIGLCAFYNCSGLTSVTIPGSVTSIGIGSFSNCASLTSVTIPDSVTRIGHDAFYCCGGLTRVTIPRRFENNLSQIGLSEHVANVRFSG